MPTQHSSFNNNESWLPTNKLKHWTKFTTLLKCNFFFKFDFNSQFSQIPFECLLCVFMCSDYQVLNASFARFIVEAYCHHWLLLSTCALIVIVNCSCWLMHQLSKSTCVLTIKTQHWLLALVFASTVNINACIDYQLWHLHWLSTSTITSIIIIDLCTHILQVVIHHWSCHSPYCSPWILVIYRWSNQSPWIIEFLLCTQIVRCQIPNTS